VRARAALALTALLLLALLAGCGGGVDTVTLTETEPRSGPEFGAEAEPSGAGSEKVYWGAWIGNQLTGEEAPFDPTAISRFTEIAGKPPSLVNFSSPFADCKGPGECRFYEFPLEEMEAVRDAGAIPLFSWASNSTPTTLDEPNFRLSNVTNGTYDPYIREWAKAAKEWGHPFFLRFNWEMNGSWFPWAESVNGNRPGEYVAAWRHVHDIFEEVGADDATWTWCPNVDPEGRLTDLRELYPGDEYVDWTCLDGYNWGPGADPPRPWRSFSSLFRPTYDEITNEIAPSKPLLIGETASSEKGGSKPGWIHGMFAALKTEFPKVRGLVWFDKVDDGMDWPLESSSEAEAAFRAGIADPRYLEGNYPDLPPGPVPTPAG
jgi:hypothetical protein